MKFHPFLRYGLHDDAVLNFPYAFLWIYQLPECTQVLSYFCQIRQSHNFSQFYRALQEPLMFPTSHARSWCFLWIPYPRGRWNGSHAIFVRFLSGAFPQTTFAFPSALNSFPLTSRALAMVDRLLVNLPLDHIYPSRNFSSNRVNCVKPVQGSEKSREPSMFQ